MSDLTDAEVAEVLRGYIDRMGKPATPFWLAVERATELLTRRYPDTEAVA